MCTLLDNMAPQAACVLCSLGPHLPTWQGRGSLQSLAIWGFLREGVRAAQLLAGLFIACLLLSPRRAVVIHSYRRPRAKSSVGWNKCWQQHPGAGFRARLHGYLGQCDQWQQEAGTGINRDWVAGAAKS